MREWVGMDESGIKKENNIETRINPARILETFPDAHQMTRRRAATPMMTF